MNVLWERGSGTVREVKEQLGDDLAYTSVLTVFQTLEKNGKVRYEQEGKAYRYYPSVSREEAGRRAVEYILRRLFRGSSEALVAAVRQVDSDSDPPRGGAHASGPAPVPGGDS